MRSVLIAGKNPALGVSAADDLTIRNAAKTFAQTALKAFTWAPSSMSWGLWWR
jgi:hypothetical protein